MQSQLARDNPRPDLRALLNGFCTTAIELCVMRVLDDNLIAAALKSEIERRVRVMILVRESSANPRYSDRHRHRHTSLADTHLADAVENIELSLDEFIEIPRFKKENELIPLILLEYSADRIRPLLEYRLNLRGRRAVLFLHELHQLVEVVYHHISDDRLLIRETRREPLEFCALVPDGDYILLAL